MALDTEAAAKPTEKPVDNDKTKKTHTFRVSWRSPRGEMFEGTFSNHVISNAQRIQIGNAAARYRGALPLDALDDETRLLSTMIAHMTVSMPEESDRPDWARNFGELMWPDLVQEIWKHVAEHEATFRGSGPDQKGG